MAEPVGVARVESHLVREPLRVERPPFHVRRDPEVLAELRYSGQLLSDRDLEVMSGNRFVERQRLGLISRARLR